jgi:pimeloyl-ACP methyl ester carboxylesterase
VFCNIFQELSSHFSVYCLDIPNAEKIEDILILLDEFLDQKIQNQIFLLGTSLGGWLAQYYALSRPGQVQALVLSSTYCTNAELRRESLRIFKISRFIPWFLFKKVFFSQLESMTPDYYKDGDYLNYAKQNIKSMGKRRFRNRLGMNVETPASLQVDDSIPKMIIYARDDPVIPKISNTEIKDTYTEAKIVELKRGGHFPYIFNSEEYSRELIEFLGSIP